MEKRRVLLHICCAPDATVPWEVLEREYDEVVGYFYGSNIYPEEEYRRRSGAVRLLEEHRRGRVLFAPWEPFLWIEQTRDYALEPEKGKRCALCFALQLYRAAAAARRYGCSHITTTLTISPHKNPEVLRIAGEAAARLQGLVWDHRIWRKGGGFQRSVAESRRLGLYRQNYCGCLYSMHREKQPNHIAG